MATYGKWRNKQSGFPLFLTKLAQHVLACCFVYIPLDKNIAFRSSFTCPSAQSRTFITRGLFGITSKWTPLYYIECVTIDTKFKSYESLQYINLEFSLKGSHKRLDKIHSHCWINLISGNFIRKFPINMLKTLHSTWYNVCGTKKFVNLANVCIEVL